MLEPTFHQWIIMIMITLHQRTASSTPPSSSASHCCLRPPRSPSSRRWTRRQRWREAAVVGQLEAGPSEFHFQYSEKLCWVCLTIPNLAKRRRVLRNIWHWETLKSLTVSNVVRPRAAPAEETFFHGKVTGREGQNNDLDLSKDMYVRWSLPPEKLPFLKKYERQPLQVLHYSLTNSQWLYLKDKCLLKFWNKGWKQKETTIVIR